MTRARGQSRPRCWRLAAGKTSNASPTSSTAVAVSNQAAGPVEFELNGTRVEVRAEGSLLDALREELGVTSPKDGCSPQGQCGCCTVWIDGAARVACVTPVARVRGRQVTTVEGLADREEWGQRFASHGASQCGFCTPGIIMRLAAMSPADRGDETKVRRALLAHLCRCTGWQPVIDAAIEPPRDAPSDPTQHQDDADRRASIEGSSEQRVGVPTALGLGGFADDDHPRAARVALRSTDGSWRVGDSLAETRQLVGKVQGRRTTTDVTWPVELPPGRFDRTLQTTWVEPAYLEPDASWCRPQGRPASPIANGGAFGGKRSTPVAAVAAELSREHGTDVRVLYSREDVVRWGPKRPPLAIGMNADGSGVVRIASTVGPLDGLEAIQARWPGLRFEVIDVAGPPVSLSLRSAIEGELRAVAASLRGGPPFEVRSGDGAIARAEVTDAEIVVTVECGDPLEPTVLTSYCTGAAHMAYSMVTSESLRLDPGGVPADLTIRSFGIVRAIDTPPIRVEVIPSGAPPVNGSDAVFAAVAAAAWAQRAMVPRWPTDADRAG